MDRLPRLGALALADIGSTSRKLDRPYWRIITTRAAHLSNFVGNLPTFRDGVSVVHDGCRSALEVADEEVKLYKTDRLTERGHSISSQPPNIRGSLDDNDRLIGVDGLG